MREVHSILEPAKGSELGAKSQHDSKPSQIVRGDYASHGADRLMSVFDNGVTLVTLLYLITEQFSAFSAGFQEPEGNSTALLTQIGVYTLCVIVMFRHPYRLLQASIRGWVPLLLTSLAVLSTGWSDVPGITFRRSLILVLTTLFGVYFGARYRSSQQLKLLAVSLAVCAALSVAAAVLLPDVGLSHDDVSSGAWQGIFSTKNLLAKTMTLSCVVFAVLPGAPRLYRTVGLFLSIGLVAASGSRTGEVVLSILCLCYLASCVLRWRRTTLLPALCFTLSALVVAVYWVANKSEHIAAALDRDTTLTGRDVLWKLVQESIANRLWLGYGYDAFWSPAKSSAAVSITQRIGWAAPHAHNGFLDLALGLGLIGVAMFSAGFVFYLVTAVVVASGASRKGAIWPLMYLVFLLLYNQTESTLLRTNSLYWMMYVAVVVSLSPSRSSPSTGVVLQVSDEYESN